MNQNAGYPYSVTLRRTKPNTSKYYGYYPKKPYDIEHHQVKGAKHGIRRYQNYDGTLTPLGRLHYGIGPARDKSVIDADNARRSELRAERRIERQTARAKTRAENKARKEAAAAEQKAREEAAATEKADMERRVKTAEKNKLMREHPEWMSDEELKADTERARTEKLREEYLRDLNRTQSENAKYDSNKTADDYFQKSKKNMTNDELREATERLIAEKRYEDAERELKQARHPFAKELFKNAAKTMVSTLAQKGAEKLANKMFEKLDSNAELKKRKETLELEKQISDLEGDSGADIVKRLTKGGFGEPTKEETKLAKRADKTLKLLDKRKAKLEELDEAAEKESKTFAVKKQAKLDSLKEERGKLESDLSRETSRYNALIEKAKAEKDYAKALEYISELSEYSSKVNKAVSRIDGDYSNLMRQSGSKTITKIDKQKQKLETDIRNGTKLYEIITKEANDRAGKRGITGNVRALFKGMSASDVERAKNLLIDMKQAMYLANEVGSGGSGREVDTNSFNFTNHFGPKGNNNGGNNNGGGGNKNKKK